MPAASLPVLISVGLAAELAGLSRKTFERRCIGTGLVKTYSAPGHFSTVDLASLERALNRTITAEDFLVAQRRNEAAQNKPSPRRQGARR
jgi:hypothetical protein